MVPSVDRINHKKGQGLVEYALLLAMLALVIAVPTMFLGPIIGNVFSKIGSPLYSDYGVQTATATSNFTPTSTATAIATPTPTPTLTPTPIPTWTTCAVENAFCSFSGTVLVRYVANSTWVSGTYTDGVLCANSVFGDPLYGTVKSCQIYQ